jgi:integrase
MHWDCSAALRDRLRSEIQSGTFKRAKAREESASGAPLSFSDVADRYLDARKRDPKRRPHRHEALSAQLELVKRTMISGANGTLVRFGDLVFEDIRRHHLDAFRDARRQVFREAEKRAAARREAIEAGAKKLPAAVGPERPGAARGETGINRTLEMLRHMFSWAVRHDYREHETPFRRKGEPDVELSKESARHRRLHAGEEGKLTIAAGEHLRACIEAVLETGMRRGEVLGLQWQDVRCTSKGKAEWVVLRPETTKTDRMRTIPVSERMATLLKRRRTDPDGEDHKADAYVFGNAVGERLDSIKTAWKATCRRAGIDDLHFHDLRREAACRWFEAGVPLHHIRDLLGHADISTTSRYLAVTPTELQRSMQMAEERQREQTQQRRSGNKQARKRLAARGESF